MILQALTEYYDRKASDPNSGIAPYGWEWKEIHYVIELNREGVPINLKYMVEGTGKNKTVKKYRVPKAVKKTSGIASNLLWDNAEYVIGIEVKAKSSDDDKKQTEKSKQKQRAFLERIEELGSIDDLGIEAVKAFIKTPLEKKIDQLSKFDTWSTLKVDSSANITFQLAGESKLISESPAFCRAVDTFNNASNGNEGICLVSGQKDEIENLHPSIRGVIGGNTTGTSIVSFNLPPFCSYEKKQGSNAPVGKKAVFKYTTALNTLLEKGSDNFIRVGEASTVVWSEKQTPLETMFPMMLREPPQDNPDQNVEKVKELFNSIHNGAYIESDSKNRFYVLGLSPNSARLAIRFWIQSTVGEIAINIARFFNDTEIVHGPKQPERLSLFRLLTSTVLQGKSENIPPNLEGEIMRAILQGSPYPLTFLAAIVRRIRAENTVTYPRAAALKACLNRLPFLPVYNNNEDVCPQQEITVALSKDNVNIGYRLGRLFATLEKIQAEANPGINATIRERFYGAASGTPVVVFPNLMRLKNYHLAKLESAGRRIYFEQLLGEIVSSFEDFPNNLTMVEQGRFAIGYYHQNQDFFTKKKDQENVDD